MNGQEGHAVCDYSSSLPSFGSGHDLYLSSNCNENKSSYSKLNRTYEVP